MGITNLRTWLGKHWQLVVLYGGVAAGLITLLGWRLGSLTAYSSGEAASAAASQGVRGIVQHPQNAPFHLLADGLAHLMHRNLLATRLTAGVCGLVTLAAFYWLVRQWHGPRAAIIGTALFGSSAWFLHTARLGTPDVLFFAVTALLACVVWLKRTANPLALILAFLLAALLLYVPGMIWLIAAGVIWQWRTIDRIFKKRLWMVSIGALLLLGIMVPLGLSIYHTPALAKVFAGLPAQGWPAPLSVAHRLADIPLNLFLRGPATPEHWLGRLPVLDAFTLTMAALGAYVYARHPKLTRVHVLGGVLIVGCVLISLGGAVSLTLILPLMYVLAACGIDLLLGRWYVVFPRNSIAQGVGLGLLGVAIAATATYSIRHYFVAWPNAPATRAVFIIREPSRHI